MEKCITCLGDLEVIDIYFNEDDKQIIIYECVSCGSTTTVGLCSSEA